MCGNACASIKIPYASRAWITPREPGLRAGRFNLETGHMAEVGKEFRSALPLFSRGSRARIVAGGPLHRLGRRERAGRRCAPALGGGLATSKEKEPPTSGEAPIPGPVDNHDDSTMFEDQAHAPDEAAVLLHKISDALAMIGFHAAAAHRVSGIGQLREILAKALAQRDRAANAVAALAEKCSRAENGDNWPGFR